MPQFSIRSLLLCTLFVAIGFALSSVFGSEYVLWLILFLIHIALVAILTVGVMEYTGHRQRFCAASLVIPCGFLACVFFGRFQVVPFDILALISLALSYFSGLMAAGAYRAIHKRGDPANCGRMLNYVTRLLAKVLPSAANPSAANLSDDGQPWHEHEATDRFLR